MDETKQDDTSTGYAGSLYQKLESDRDPYLKRARECSELTLPTLIPPAAHSRATKYYTPWQGIGARGVNNLASKLLLALLPPNSPCFRLQIDDFTLEEMTQQEGMRGKVEEGLNKIERSVQSEIEATAIRITTFELLKHLIVGGNGLVYLPQKTGGMKFYSLERFVAQRDYMGNLLRTIVKETVSASQLPPDVQELIEYDPATETRGEEKQFDIFTLCELKDGKWKQHQEIKGKIIPGSQGTYPADKNPWIPVRLIKIDGENYGRGYVEEYLGDIKSLEGLSQSIVEGSAAAAKVLFLVNPNGTTSQATIAEAPNAAVVEGNEQDVSVLQLQKYNDFRVALETAKTIEERLAFAFLLNSAVQRNGDRVTAEEIRYMAQELESALGGVYSILSLEFQLPMVKQIMFNMERKRKLPVLPKGTVKPVVVTGLEALGRGNDLNKLITFLDMAIKISQLPPEINKSDALTRAGTSLGMDMKGLVLSEDELAAQQQQMMQMQMMQQGIGPAINQVGNLTKEAMTQGQGETSGAS